MNKLTTFKITYLNGDVTITNMAVGVTLEMAQKHFIGQKFELSEWTFSTAIKVEKID